MASIVIAFPSGLIVGQVLKLSGHTYSDGFINNALMAPNLLIAIALAALAQRKYNTSSQTQQKATIVTDEPKQPND
jgi:hypothetical protein